MNCCVHFGEMTSRSLPLNQHATTATFKGLFQQSHVPILAPNILQPHPPQHAHTYEGVTTIVQCPAQVNDKGVFGGWSG